MRRQSDCCSSAASVSGEPSPTRPWCLCHPQWLDSTGVHQFLWAVMLSRLSFATIIVPIAIDKSECFKGWNDGKHHQREPGWQRFLMFLGYRHAWYKHIQKQTGWDSFSSRSFRALGTAKQHSQWTRPSNSLGIWRTSCAGKTAIPLRASNRPYQTMWSKLMKCN